MQLCLKNMQISTFYYSLLIEITVTEAYINIYKYTYALHSC